MEQSAVLLVGRASAAAAQILRASSLLADCRVLDAQDVDRALAILDAEDRVAAALVLWNDADATALPIALARIQDSRRHPLMAVAVRSETPLPAAIATRLWEAGVADRRFDQPAAGDECAEFLATAARGYARQRALCAITEASARLAAAASFGELAILALHIVKELDVHHRGAAFCFQRNTSQPQLLALVGTGTYATINCTPAERVDRAPVWDIVRTAWESRASRFADSHAAIYVGTPSHPALILLALDAPLLPWQQCMLESYAKAIAPAVEESQLAQQLLRTQRAMISTLATLAEYKDTDTGEHVARVARITAEIASFLQHADVGSEIDAYFLEHIGHASILHDIGKVAIPESVLLKAGPLDAAERLVINNHVVIGHEMLKKAAALAAHGEARLFRLASEIALGHHERYDGGGYPHGLAGDAIPLSARIVAVVDVFDALVSHRPYKKAWSVEQALDLIRQESGHHFDPRIVEAFIAVHERKGATKFIQWTPAMSVGHGDLDRDHQRLIGILNHLGINIELGNHNIVEFILDDLSDYARVHFRREEEHLENLGFAELERHRKIHEGITHRIEDAKWKYFQGLSGALEGELLNFLTAWLNHHILVEDMKYSRYPAPA